MNEVMKRNRKYYDIGSCNGVNLGESRNQKLSNTNFDYCRSKSMREQRSQTQWMVKRSTKTNMESSFDSLTVASAYPESPMLKKDLINIYHLQKEYPQFKFGNENSR
jgi:hypothetical protein